MSLSDDFDFDRPYFYAGPSYPGTQIDAHLLFGPLTPWPDRSLADVVAEIAGVTQ